MKVKLPAICFVICNLLAPVAVFAADISEPNADREHDFGRDH